MNTNLKEFVKELIIDRLECNYKGFNLNQDLYELPVDIFWDWECDGTVGVIENDKEWIIKYWDDIGTVLNELPTSYLDTNDMVKLLLDIFDQPQKFNLFIVREYAAYLLCKCKTIYSNSNTGEITFTDELIDKLIEEIKEL
jgi:hypothetical protein